MDVALKTNPSKIIQDVIYNDVYNFSTYIESANDWGYLAAIPSPLDQGKGYLISLNPASDGIIQFTGTQISNEGVTPSVASTLT